MGVAPMPHNWYNEAVGGAPGQFSSAPPLKHARHLPRGVSGFFTAPRKAHQEQRPIARVLSAAAGGIELVCWIVRDAPDSCSRDTGSASSAKLDHGRSPPQAQAPSSVPGLSLAGRRIEKRWVIARAVYS